ncbi:excisionase [Paenibacillus sp. Soil750]|uniref:excisionase n=1 Tax=Paenibacillus sp. Soil750 TaxID=1736398 RepID=UPI000701DBBE|nr:excisionase [Paenibacillus sp. Soil750]KRE70765.1 excisionase [Paenibacillus sp. Soil750]
MEINDYPVVLQAKHVTQILGVAKSTTYELFRETGFPLLEINGRKLVYRDSFFAWLDSKQRNCGGLVR